MELKYDIYKLRNSQGSGEERKYVRIVQNEPMSAKQLQRWWRPTKNYTSTAKRVS